LAKAAVHCALSAQCRWMPACAGMTTISVTLDPASPGMTTISVPLDPI
jgi:hypothetical protein